MLNISIVIYLKENNGNINLFRDFRTVNSQVQNNKYIFVTRKNQLFFSNCLDWRLEKNLKFTNNFQIVSVSDNWTNDISQMCQLPSASSIKVTNHIELLLQSKQLFEIWQKRILIVTFCSFKKNYAQNTKLSMFSGKNIFVNVLGCIAENNFKLTKKDNINFVLLLYGGLYFYFLQPLVETNIIESLISPHNLDKLSDNGYQQIPKLSTHQINTCREQKKRLKKQKKGDEIKKICKCNLCVQTNYDDNMSKGGPEQLDIVQPHISALLEMLNLNSDEHLRIIEQLCEYSVASFDIESMTQDTDHLPADEFFPVEEIENRGTEIFTSKVQKPIMISHCDAISIELNEDLTVTTSSDKEEDIYEMMITYWNIVCRQRELAYQRKLTIVKPLNNIISQYTKAFFNLCGENMEIGKGNWESAWKATLFGKLDVALKQLVDKYVVFSFYG